jgi:hypothetical protein
VFGAIIFFCMYCNHGVKFARSSFVSPGLTISLILVMGCMILVSNWMTERNSGLKSLPGPFSLPFLGCLHLLAAKKIPFAAFTDMIQVRTVDNRLCPLCGDVDQMMQRLLPLTHEILKCLIVVLPLLS